MKRQIRWVACAAAWGVALAGAGGAVRPDDVTGHLERTIAWYRQVNAVEQSAGAYGDMLSREGARQAALNALQLAFDFARGEAALLSAVPGGGTGGSGQEGGSGTPGQNLQRAAARSAERVARMEARVAGIGEELARASARAREVLTAQRKEAQAELALAKEVQQAIQSQLSFAGSMSGGNGAGGLTGQILRFERLVPEVARTATQGGQGSGSKTAAAAAAVPASSVAPVQPFQPETAGIFALSAELFSLAEARRQLNSLAAETEALSAATRQLRAPLLNELRPLIRRSDELAGDSTGQDVEQLAADQREVTAMTARFRLLSAAMVPLGQQAFATDSALEGIADWRQTVNRQYSAAGRYLTMRGSVLAAAIAVILLIGAFGRRVTFRYVKETRRRRQFLLLWRVLVTCAIVLAVMAAFVREFGALATYAGLLTAGIALALQNVILSVVAYFFLIGRHGVRVGDRVTAGGVTGDVIDIGLVRFYLMEMVGPGPDLRPSGRVVAFSNSVLFQPAALYKQMPETDFVWRSVRLTLTPASDFQTAQARLGKAVEDVYAGHRDAIEKQHEAIERTVNLHVSVPQPDCRLRFTPAGLEFAARYPVRLQNALETDERVMKALYDAVAAEPKLELAAAGAPVAAE